MNIDISNNIVEYIITGIVAIPTVGYTIIRILKGHRLKDETDNALYNLNQTIQQERSNEVKIFKELMEERSKEIDQRLHELKTIHEAEIKLLNKKIKEIETSLENLRKLYKNSLEEKEQLIKRIDFLQEEINTLSNENTQLRKENTDLNKRIYEQELKIQELTIQLNRI